MQKGAGYLLLFLFYTQLLLNDVSGINPRLHLSDDTINKPLELPFHPVRRLGDLLLTQQLIECAIQLINIRHQA